MPEFSDEMYGVLGFTPPQLRVDADDAGVSTVSEVKPAEPIAGRPGYATGGVFTGTGELPPFLGVHARPGLTGPTVVGLEGVIEARDRARQACAETVAIRDALRAKIAAVEAWELAHPVQHFWRVLLGRPREFLLTPEELEAARRNARWSPEMEQL